MFKIIPNPTFNASITIVGRGREQTLNVVFRHKTRSEFKALTDNLGSADSADIILALVESWDADSPVSRESIQQLGEHQPGADYAIINAYAEALMVERKKN